VIFFRVALMLTMQRHPREFPVMAKSVFDGGILIT
jgi:hypothetical protein